MRDPEQELRDAIRAAAVEALGLEPDAIGTIPVTWPPKPEMGDLASPICFELAKVARRAPRELAQKIVESYEPRGGIARLEVAGAPVRPEESGRFEVEVEVARSGPVELVAYDVTLLDH